MHHVAEAIKCNTCRRQKNRLAACVFIDSVYTNMPQVLQLQPRNIAAFFSMSQVLRLTPSSEVRNASSKLQQHQMKYYQHLLLFATACVHTITGRRCSSGPRLNDILLRATGKANSKDVVCTQYGVATTRRYFSKAQHVEALTATVVFCGSQVHNIVTCCCLPCVQCPQIYSHICVSDMQATVLCWMPQVYLK
jgi:hypothetical protein